MNSSAPQCSICLDPVVENNGARSTARLRCGHVFHLDCIGSEFNVKGVMQCPNCRAVEDGEWHFAAGGFEQSVDEANREEEQYHIEMMVQHLSGPRWCPFDGFQEFPPTVLGERILTRTANSLTQEVFVAAGGSNIVGPSHMHPLNGHQVATGIPTHPSINGNHLHQHNWLPQAPFPSMDNTVNVANPALNSPAILRIAGTFSYRGAGQEPSARPIRHDRRSSAGTRGSAHASSSSPYQRSNVPPLSRFRIPREQPSNNLPSPAVRASMLANMRGSRNLPVWHRAEPSLSSTTQQAGYGTNQVLQPRVSSGVGYGTTQVLQPCVSSGAGYDMQQGLTSDDMPPEDEADDSSVTMFQFL